MSRYSIPLDFADALAAPGRCPACGSAVLEPVAVAGEIRFACRSCRHGWQVAFGRLVAVEPVLLTDQERAAGG